MRRRTFGLAVAAAAGFGLSACSDGGGGGGEDLAMPEDTEISASLNYGIWDDVQAPAMEEIISAFNEEYPNIEVNITIAPFDQYFTRLQTQRSEERRVGKECRCGGATRDEKKKKDEQVTER